MNQYVGGRRLQSFNSGNKIFGKRKLQKIDAGDTTLASAWDSFDPDKELKLFANEALIGFMELFCTSRFIYKDIGCKVYEENGCWTEKLKNSEKCRKIAGKKFMIKRAKSECEI